MRTNVSESVRPWPARLPLLAGAALLVATLDMALAMGFWSAHGVAPERVLQSVASGLAGRAAFAGGVATAVLGLALHLSIALAMVLAYDAIALRLPWLVRRPWLAGPLYGGVLYLVMTGIVLPLSAAPHATLSIAWLAASVFSHVVLVGLPCALLVRAAQAPVARGAGPVAAPGAS